MKFALALQLGRTNGIQLVEFFVRGGFVDFTSSTPVVLGANGMPTTAVDERADRLEANILIFGEGADLLVIVTCDLLYIGARLRALVEHQLSDLVSPQYLFMAASHTHRATMVDPCKPALGVADAQQIEAVGLAIAGAVREVYRLEKIPVSVEVSYGNHGAGINRRKRHWLAINRQGLQFNAVHLAPNPNGPIDPTIRRLRFVKANGQVAAELWSTALHPTGYPLQGVVSADFPGRVREALRQAAGSEIAVGFLQGFSGDIRPKTPVTPMGLRRMLRGPGFAAFTPEQYEDWVNVLVQKVLSIEFGPLSGKGIRAERTPIERSLFVQGESGPDHGWVHAIRLGDMALVGVPSEVVVEYSSSLDPRTSGDSDLQHIWGVGCIDHVWGYAPTQKMLTEGGYEAGGFCPYFGVDQVNPGIENELRLKLQWAVRSLV